MFATLHLAASTVARAADETRMGAVVQGRFGAQDTHEVSLNYMHVSNAGLKKPNPGEDFVQLRYAYRF